jgi:hypothetical protein
MNEEENDVPDSPKTLEIEKLSGWDLKEILRKAADYVEKHQFDFYHDVEDSVKNSLGYLIKTVEVAHENHQKAMDEHYDRLENTYSEYVKKRLELSEKIKYLPTIKFPDVPYVPYVNTESLQKLLDMAEKLSNLSEEQWKRLLEISSVLK